MAAYFLTIDSSGKATPVAKQSPWQSNPRGEATPTPLGLLSLEQKKGLKKLCNFIAKQKRNHFIFCEKQANRF